MASTSDRQASPDHGRPGRSAPGAGYWIAKGALQHPGRTALVTPEGRVTYGELAARVRRVAGLLGQLGLREGDRVGVLMRNDRRFVELLLASARAGTVAVPLNWRLTVRELEHPVQDAGTSVLFAGPEDREAAEVLAERCDVRLVTVPDEYERRLEDVGQPEGAPDSPDSMDAFPGDDEPALIVYTSGTTGTPKGAVLTHANLFWNALNDVLALGLDWRDVTLTLLPLMHVGGIGLFTLPTLLAGGTVVMPRSFDPGQALRLIEREGVTLFLGVPTVHRMLVESSEFESADLGSLRLVYNGGDRCPLAIVEAYRERGIPFGGGYGLTETSPTAFLPEPDQLEASTREPGFMGKPALGLDARLVDASGRDVEPGEVGEVVLRGPVVFREYWGMEEATEAAFTDGWFHTGDLARRDEDGFWFFAGRSKEMIKSGGENIYPAEVESALREHPGVSDACVIGREHPKWVEVPFAVVERAEGTRLEEDELRSFCGGRLARYKIPTGFAFVDEMPRTPIGKPDRPRLRERYGGAREEAT
ncbi:MAG: class I adenylate-forming enzyme family protein [Gemmatimonadota bacterium]